MATRDSISRAKQKTIGTSTYMIGLMGKVKAGKSVFINEARGRREEGKFIEGGPRTTEVEQSSDYWEIGNRRYYLVEIPGFQNDEDGAIIRNIAKFLIQVYEKRGFAGIIYLHDINQDRSRHDVEQDHDLISSIIGKGFYSRTTLVLNKYEETMVQQCATRREIIREIWNLPQNHGPSEAQNPAPRGKPIPIVERMFGRDSDALAFAKELMSGKKGGKKKLCKTQVGRVYQKQLEGEIKRIKGDGDQVDRRKRMKKELERWKSLDVQILQGSKAKR